MEILEVPDSHLEQCYSSITLFSYKLYATRILKTQSLNDCALKPKTFGTQRRFNALQGVPSIRTAGVSFMKVALPPFAYKTQAVLKH